MKKHKSIQTPHDHMETFSDADVRLLMSQQLPAPPNLF